VNISGGTADFASNFSENVAFMGTTGVLELGKSEFYTGTLTGFSQNGATSLDLADIPYVAGTTRASFSGSTTSGVLTVSDGVSIASIQLAGNFTASTFTLSAAPGGGTMVVDPMGPAPLSRVGLPPAHQLIAAAAGFGTDADAPHARILEPWIEPPPRALAAPRVIA